MKIFLLILLVSLGVKAETNYKIVGEVQWMSDYVSRGVSQNNNESTLQGWLGVNHKFTTVGIFTTQVYMPVSATEIAKRYNLYFVDQIVIVNKDLYLNFKTCGT